MDARLQVVSSACSTVLEHFSLILGPSCKCCLVSTRHHMHDAVYWLAADPFDTRPDEWRPNLINYAWVCNMNRHLAPSDRAGFDQFQADYRMVTSVSQCHQVRHHWKNNQMRSVTGRTRLDTNSTEWTSAARTSDRVHR